jgi:Flp pilus assembly protein TadD
VAAALLALATLAVFWPATRCDFINFDDPDYVTANAHIQKGLTPESIQSAFTDIISANWHPLTMLSHALDCQIYGLNPWGHHLTNVLWHVLNTVLVFGWLRQMTGSLWRSLFVAALFGLHPLRVESVAWVAERKDVLSTCLGLLSLIFYVRYAQNQAPATGASSGAKAAPVASRRAAWSYAFAGGFLILGLLSKPMLVTWPFVMLLLDYWPLQRLTSGRLPALLREKIPFFALAAVMSVVTLVVQKHHGAMVMENLSFGARCENAVVSYARYIGKMLFPTDLVLPYPHPGSWPVWAVVSASGLIAGISAAAWCLRRRQPFLLMGWLWFCGTLLPVIGLVQVGVQSIADRYTYIPSLGLLILLAWGAGEIVARLRPLKIPLVTAGAACAAACAALTLHQIGYWQNSEILFGRAVEVTKNNFYAHYNLGNAVLMQNRFDDAIRQFEEAVSANPGFANGYNNLGGALRSKGDSEGAARAFREAVRLRPNVAEWHFNLGVVLGKQGNLAEAVSEFQAAVRLEPGSAVFHNMLGIAANMQGNADEAIGQFREAIRLEPDDPVTHYNLGKALDQKGQVGDAISELREALRLRPDFGEAHDLMTELQLKNAPPTR